MDNVFLQNFGSGNTIVQSFIRPKGLKASTIRVRYTTAEVTSFVITNNDQFPKDLSKTKSNTSEKEHIIQATNYSVTNLVSMVDTCQNLINRLRGAFSEEEIKNVEKICGNNHILKKILELWTKPVGALSNEEKRAMMK